jgi:hypothetical protein
MKCAHCGRNFTNQNALDMHTKVKHGIREVQKPRRNLARIRNYGILFIILAFSVFAVYRGVESSGNYCLDTPAKDMNIGGHYNLAMHTHQMLRIVILGEEQLIPANVGIQGNIMRPVHTHDTTGQLHVEAACIRDFTLGDFFEIWGERFDGECILGYCADENNQVRMFVNGGENVEFENLVLRDGQVIEIVYG